MLEHNIVDFRRSTFDEQTTIYICACGYKTSLRFDQHFKDAVNG